MIMEETYFVNLPKDLVGMLSHYICPQINVFHGSEINLEDPITKLREKLMNRFTMQHPCVGATGSVGPTGPALNEDNKTSIFGIKDANRENQLVFRYKFSTRGGYRHGEIQLVPFLNDIDKGGAGFLWFNSHQIYYDEIEKYFIVGHTILKGNLAKAFEDFLREIASFIPNDHTLVNLHHF